jgi:CHASE2 domain-containing sensor protein
VVTIVDMTELHQRGEIAGVLQAIEAHHPKVVGVDIVFEGLKEDTLGDDLLRRVAADHSGNVVYSYRMLDYVDAETGYADDIHSFFAYEGIDVHEGFTDFERTLYSGVKRKLSLHRRCKGEERTSLVANVASLYADEELETGDSPDLSINFRPTVFRVIPSDSVGACGDLIADHVVLFGATRELSDMHYTPLGKIAGIELLAYSVQTLLEHSQVRSLPLWLTILVSFVVALASWLWLSSYSAWAGRRKSEVLRFFFTMTFVKGVLVFIWMGLLIWLAFLIFCQWHVSINLTWGLAVIPLLAGANEFRTLVGKMLRRKTQ